ncbi:porin [Undibacterium sp. TS12]|uniref:porin n=1 Tax=Undibacterium sp. TS12 TaxID=2908202 RepID=UPI001F4C5B21|nr:porin [Undibacterium sp. TS12]MCH8620352.1 porin [Undibacterium sp. TS12]
MKKPLLALVVLGVFSGATYAQSSVTVYGVADLGFVLERGGPAGSVSKISSGVEAGSRLGFKGSEDLGNGLSTYFVLEMGIGMDTGGSNQGNTAFGRQALVGFKGDFGSISLGRQYTPLFLALDNVDPFGTGLAGASTNLFAYYPTTGNPRVKNAVVYKTPAMNGFSGSVVYGFGEVAGSTAASRQMGLSVNYESGPVVLTFAHHETNDATASDSEKTTLVGGTYNVGPAMVHLVYDSNSGVGGARNDDFLVGVSAPVGAGKLMLSYIRKNDKSSLNQDASQLAIGYTYALSKRTNVYTSYARISNKNGGAYTVGNAIESGTGDQAFNLGIRHTF